MPELMFQYRAASFFGRLYAPDILKGMQTVDEVKDVFSTIDTDFEDVSKHEEVVGLFKELEDKMDGSTAMFVQSAIDNKITKEYDKILYQLKKLKDEQQAK